MAILLTIVSVLFIQVLYLMFRVKRKLNELEDTIHGIHHDIDIKIDEIETKVKNGKTL